MLRICRKCNAQYDGDPGSTLCPACVQAARTSTIRDRVCRTCGATFPGGPRAWYCPTCRADRQKTQRREAYRRKVAGNTRALGSEDLCTICGKPYVVASGLQRYCPACAQAAWAEADRQQGREYYVANRDPAARKAQRKACTADLLCVVCGKPYKPTNSARTCSPGCSAILQKQHATAWEISHREQRNQYHRELAKAKKEKNNE